jgi:hypothetical protein
MPTDIEILGGHRLPHLRAWAGKYSGKGLVVIGVHTPEFSFERDPDNVGQAVREMGITYQVATDNNYALWQAFGNHYWPSRPGLPSRARRPRPAPGAPRLHGSWGAIPRSA